MIQANELRIGNYILNNDKLFRIVGIDQYKIRSKRYDQVSDLPIYCDYLTSEWIKPILLTEDILIKFGFKRFSLNKFSIGSFFIHFEGNLIMCMKSGVLLTTVHQLQNLYFALINQELNINNLK
jgi:hypothetical protein